MKTLKLLGIAALAALLVFGVVACGDPEEPPEVTLSPSGDDVYIYDTLTVTVSGVSYDYDLEWYDDGDIVAGVTGETYTPKQPGFFSVVVKSKGSEKDLESNEVEVKGHAAAAFFGTWLMDASSTNPDNSAWKNSPLGGAYNETLTITSKSYKIDSAKLKDGNKEHFYFAITGWTPTTTGSQYYTGYEAGLGFTLTGSTTSALEYAETNSFSIYLNADKTLQVSERNTTLKRYYKKQP